LTRLRDVLPVADSKVEIKRVMTLDTHLSEALAMERLTTVLVGACGVLTLVLAIVGVYGVMADAVARRTRELGVRAALGARPMGIVWLIFSQGLELAGVGAVVGIVLALASGRLLRALLDEAAPLDARTLAGIAMLLMMMVLLAAIVPVLRALRVSPTVALRQE
jgi:ABC-type antimicrobial peptide transport system permease subunit